MTDYQEPQVSFLILDFQRERAARQCLQSLRDHVRFPARFIYCHNGAADYPLDLLRAGYIDDLIMPRENGGLGLGTRALFAACFSQLAVSWQVDQIMGRDFTLEELDRLADLLGQTYRAPGINHQIIKSISLAGSVCGHNVFSERAFIMKTRDYKRWEQDLPLSPGGAGPFHHQLWREGQLQAHYKENDYLHWTDWPPLAIDNGRDAVRQNPDGSIWKHEPDRKGLWLVQGPVKERYVYPKLSEQEWRFVLDTQSWPPGAIPEQERKDSFHVWN